MWETVDLADTAATRRVGNALDDGTEPRRPAHDVSLYDFSATVERLIDASGSPRETS